MQGVRYSVLGTRLARYLFLRRFSAAILRPERQIISTSERETIPRASTDLSKTPGGTPMGPNRLIEFLLPFYSIPTARRRRFFFTIRLHCVFFICPLLLFFAISLRFFILKLIPLNLNCKSKCSTFLSIITKKRKLKCTFFDNTANFPRSTSIRVN